MGNVSDQKKYEDIEALRAKNPGMSIAKAARELGYDASGYYNHRNRSKALPVARKAAAKPAVSYEKITDQPPMVMPMVLVMGSPDQLRQFAAGLYQ